MSNIEVPDKNIIQNYLSLFKLSEKKYLIGIFQEGITIYKQQVRALNIFQALCDTGKIKIDDRDFNIGIIGGGIAGLTFAAAAAKVGIKATIFENKSVYMHMQYGCDTRIVHPNIYDWPDKRSTFPYAEIPILQWKAGTASRVTYQLVKSFNGIKTEHPGTEVKTIFNCTITKIEDISNDQLKISYHQGTKRLARVVNMLIFATGYGIEKGVESESKTPSYWRNDDYAQPSLSKKNGKYFISGTGDGGLLDLFRLKILGFSIESFLHNLKIHCKYEILVNALNGIKKQWKDLIERDGSVKNGWLYEKFDEIGKEIYADMFTEYFSKRVVINREVVLIGNGKEFEHVLDLSKISMLNAFIVFLLYRETSFFTYTLNPLVFNKEKGFYTIHNKRVNGTVIIRHGTDKTSLLKEENFLTSSEKKMFKKLKSDQKNNLIYNSTNLLFGYSGLNSLLNKKGDKRFEFFTPETTIICSSFISVLSSALKFHQSNAFPRSKFRVCLHRAVKNGEEGMAYQQITPYYGDTTFNAFKSVLLEPNIEKRRIMFDCIGVARLFKELNPELLDQQIIIKVRTR